MDRPHRFGSERRDQQVNVRLSQSDRDALTAIAEANEMTVSGFVAGIVELYLNDRRPDPIDQGERQLAARQLLELRGELGRLGNNINQIAHVANASGSVNPERLTRLDDALRDVFGGLDSAITKLAALHTSPGRI